MSFHDDTQARRILGLWRGAHEAHIRSDLQRVSNEAKGPKGKRMSVSLKAIWNKPIRVIIRCCILLPRPYPK